jgi:hypothetical protein
MRIQPNVPDHDVRERPSAAVAPTTIQPTPTDDDLPRRFADFATMPDALDYAAQGRRGMNFHDARGNLVRAYPFAELREDALAAAARLVARGIAPKDRVALVAETAPEFVALFFGALYAGAWPVPLPLPTSFGGREAYIDQLATQLRCSDPVLLLYPAELAALASAGAEAAGVESLDWESFAEAEAPATELQRRRVGDFDGDVALPLRFERSNIYYYTASCIRAFSQTNRQHVARDAEVLDRAGEGEAVGGDNADVALVGGHCAAVDLLGIDHSELAGGRREDAELVGHANIIAIAAQAVGDNAFAHLVFDKRLNHAVLERHAADPVIGFDRHGKPPRWSG